MRDSVEYTVARERLVIEINESNMSVANIELVFKREIIYHPYAVL